MQSSSVTCSCSANSPSRFSAWMIRARVNFSNGIGLPLSHNRSSRVKSHPLNDSLVSIVHFSVIYRTEAAMNPPKHSFACLGFHAANFSRRHALKVGGLGLLGLTMPNLLQAEETRNSNLGTRNSELGTRNSP